jgi:hypothetical protein
MGRMQGLQAAADLLAQRAARPSHPVEFRPLAPAPRAALPACAAVDGSSAVLVDNGSAWVVAYRAASVPWPGERPVEPAPEVAAALPAEAQALADDAYARAGLASPAIRTADAFADALRSLAEHQAATAAVARLPAGGLLLLDGALHGLPAEADAAMARLAEACRVRGVRLAGVAKRSGIEGSGVPLVPALLAEAASRGMAGPWAVEAGPGVHVAKLHAAARHAFRVDGDPGLLPLLAALSDDAVYAGYPYPLAKAHNLVALTGAHVRDLQARLDLELLRRGRAAAGLARDFHDVLDANVPG